MHQSINQWFILLNNPIGFSKSGRRFAEPPARQSTHEYFTMGEQVDHNGATQYAVWWNMLTAECLCCRLVKKTKRKW